MSDEEAAKEFAQFCYCAGPMCSGCEENTQKIFLAGIMHERKESKEKLRVATEALQSLGYTADLFMQQEKGDFEMKEALGNAYAALAKIGSKE